MPMQPYEPLPPPPPTPSDLPWRVRKPLSELNAEPRLATPARSNPASAVSVKRPRKTRAHMPIIGVYDPLEVTGAVCARTKEQIDAFERMLHQAMPCKVVLDNSFAGIRNCIADEMEAIMEAHFKRGVQHGELIGMARVDELEAELHKIRMQYHDMNQSYCELLADRNNKTEDDELCIELANFLENVESADSELDIEGITASIAANVSLDDVSIA